MERKIFVQNLLQTVNEMQLHIFAEGERCICQRIIANSLYENLSIQGESGNLESIFVAKIDKIMPSANGAFLDIGDKKMAFLPLQEKPSFMHQNPEPLKQGMKILVQVKKEENRNKGALLTRDIKIAGKYLMLMPFNTHITWSTRIEDKAIQSKLLRFGKMLSKGKFGIVFRSLAESASEEEMRLELAEQSAKLETILKTYQNIKPPQCLYRQNHGVLEYCLDIKKLNIPCLVKVNNLSLMEGLQKIQTQNFGITYDSSIEKKQFGNSVIMQREIITLSNQANIVIDYCEALTVFDINSAAAKYQDVENSFFQTNCIAAVEIFRQIQLQNIAGVILIDFINMKEEEYEQLLVLLQALKRYDRIPMIIHGFTRTGLLEITRKRTIAGDKNEINK